MKKYCARVIFADPSQQYTFIGKFSMESSDAVKRESEGYRTVKEPSSEFRVRVEPEVRSGGFASSVT